MASGNQDLGTGCSCCYWGVTASGPVALGAVLLPRGHLAMSGQLLVVTAGGRGRCCWHLEGRDQRCHETSCRLRRAPPQRAIPRHVSEAATDRAVAAGKWIARNLSLGSLTASHLGLREILSWMVGGLVPSSPTVYSHPTPQRVRRGASEGWPGA